MKKPLIVKRVCMVDSLYTLLIYLLISSRDEIEHTYFFTTNQHPRDLLERLPGRYHAFDYYSRNKKTSRARYLSLIAIRWLSRLRWPFLLWAPLYGQDHVFFSYGLVGYRKMTVLEDGLGNYIEHKQSPLRWKKLQSFLFGPLYTSLWYGRNDRCKELILTGLASTKNIDDLHPTIISLQQLWNDAPQDKKQLILDIYGLNNEEIDDLRQKKVILLTQPWNEDFKAISEEDKIEAYRKILADYNPDEVVIKPHPREKTNYREVFKGYTVFDKRVPMEILNFLGIRFSKVVTITSTAAYTLGYDTEIIFTGPAIHPKILATTGDAILDVRR